MTHHQTLSVLPINHVFEQVVGVLLPLTLGGKVSFCESLKKLGENLAEVRPTFFLGVPACRHRMILDRIMKNIDVRPLSEIRYTFPVTRPLVTSKIRRPSAPVPFSLAEAAALDPAVAAGLRNGLGLSIYRDRITETAPIISAEPRLEKAWYSG